MQPYSDRHGNSNWAPAAARSRRNKRHKSRHGYKSRKRIHLAILLCLAAVLLLAYPFVNPFFPETERVSLLADDLPSDIGHLRIVYLTDIHYGYFYHDLQLQRLISAVNNLKPDLVLLGGDYAIDNLSAIRFFEHLSGIHARYAILGVVGDTDRGEENYELTQLKEAMRMAGITPVVNTAQQVRIGNSSIYVAGLDDVNTGKPDIKTVASSVRAEDYVILLSHSPSVLGSCQSATGADGKLNWFDLALFGHTHGGQIPPLASLLNLAEDVNSYYTSGWFKENRVDILVSNGIGTEKIPARLFCPAQIHVIDVSRN